ncbi:MAG: MazG family protein, partial [Nitrospirae bacterium]|nr:MazG family protein [Nitrospirota bacterium]
MSQAFDHLLELISHLRSPDGCAWDRKQTHDTLRSHLLEETYEVLETLDQQEPNSLKEELGDLLLQVLLHAHIEEEEGHFSMNDVVIHLSEKLIRRHP